MPRPCRSTCPRATRSGPGSRWLGIGEARPDHDGGVCIGLPEGAVADGRCGPGPGRRRGPGRAPRAAPALPGRRVRRGHRPTARRGRGRGGQPRRERRMPPPRSPPPRPTPSTSSRSPRSGSWPGGRSWPPCVSRPSGSRPSSSRCCWPRSTHRPSTGRRRLPGFPDGRLVPRLPPAGQHDPGGHVRRAWPAARTSPSTSRTASSSGCWPRRSGGPSILIGRLAGGAVLGAIQAVLFITVFSDLRRPGPLGPARARDPGRAGDGHGHRHRGRDRGGRACAPAPRRRCRTPSR